MGLFDKAKKTKDEEVVAGETVVEVEKNEETKKPVSKRSKTKKADESKEKSDVAETSTKTDRRSKANDALIHSVVSEKAAVGESMGVYTFVVKNDANKIEIKKAVRDIYGVLPVKVRVLNIEGKNTRFGNKFGRRSSWKKAIVTLPKDKTINIHEGV